MSKILFHIEWNLFLFQVIKVKIWSLFKKVLGLLGGNRESNVKIENLPALTKPEIRNDKSS